MKLLPGASVLFLSFVVSWLVTKTLIRVLPTRGVLDVPNPRSSHRIPTPRGGGVGIIAGLAAGALVGWLLEIELPREELFAGAALVAIAGAIDDYSHRVPILARLALHSSAALILVAAVGGLPRFPLPSPLDFPLGILAAPVAILWIVGVTNLYNFLDGIDGFASSQGVIAGLGIVVLAPGQGSSVPGFAIAGACGGFLLHNWHPARIFMGDVGSATLGFILAAMPLEFEPEVRGHAVFVMAMLLWFFLSDGLFTILRRLFHGEKIWLAHRSHLYQRLVKTGLRHDEVVIVVSALALPIAGLAVAAGKSGAASLEWIVLVLALAGFLLYTRWTVRREATCRRALSVGETV